MRTTEKSADKKSKSATAPASSERTPKGTTPKGTVRYPPGFSSDEEDDRKPSGTVQSPPVIPQVTADRKGWVEGGWKRNDAASSNELIEELTLSAVQKLHSDLLAQVAELTKRLSASEKKAGDGIRIAALSQRIDALNESFNTHVKKESSSCDLCPRQHTVKQCFSRSGQPSQRP